MDTDSAHHANIALHMYLTGDYVSLVDHAGDYLDKPHLHFWLCAFSYKLFGVTTFAYKFPSLLFTVLGVYSTYRLGRALYNTEVGKLSALILASSFAFILANNDVRMDAILTACIAFAIWQLVEFVQNKKGLNIAGAALGLALGFSTKGSYCRIHSGDSNNILYSLPERMETFPELEMVLAACFIRFVHCPGAVLLLLAVQSSSRKQLYGEKIISME